MVGMQLPIQAQSTMFAAAWEAEAGPDELTRVARTCEDVGFDYVGACDHIAIPRTAAAAMSTYWMDPIATLSWIAASTERIALLTHVYVLAYRHPLVAAKQLATLDHLSSGRLIAGVGAGHVREEFEALGLDFERRGRILDEGLPTLAAALESEYVDNLGARPRPVQQPRPPIWIAGSSAPALRRAAKFGDGWLPQGPATAEQIASVRSQLDAIGRDDSSFVFGHIARPVHIGQPDWDAGPHTITGSADQVADALRRETPAGVNQIQLRVVARSAAECCEQIALAGESLLPALRMAN